MSKVKKVKVTPNNPVSDLLIDEWFENVKDNDCIPVSTEAMLTRLRLAIVEGDIEPFILINNGNEYMFNEHARLNDNSAWPFEKNCDMVHKILLNRFNKVK